MLNLISFLFWCYNSYLEHKIIFKKYFIEQCFGHFSFTSHVNKSSTFVRRLRKWWSHIKEEVIYNRSLLFCNNARTNKFCCSPSHDLVKLSVDQSSADPPNWRNKNKIFLAYLLSLSLCALTCS